MNRKINIYQYGNTVRLKCVFHDFNNDIVSPDLVKLTIYNYKYEILHEILINENNGVIGEYIYDYITENKRQKLYYEWYGEINGKPSLKRGEFTTDFI